MLLSWNDIRGLGCLLLLLIVSMAPHGADAQESKVSINDLVNDTQKQSNDPNTMNMIWWIPEEYWVAVAADDPSFTEDEVQEILEVLRPYTLIAVADGKMGPFGGITWTSEVDIRNNISLIGTDGIRYNPISAQNINPDARNLMSM